MANDPTQTTADLLRWVRKEIVTLCEATEDDPAISAIGERDTEGKMGAFNRGRIFEAKQIRNAMADVISAKIRALS